MIKLYILLFIQFFHIGFFSFGGGYATLPFLYEISAKYEWFTFSQLSNMLAISSITPGPIGVNMATFSGFTTSGIVGALIATTAIMLPSYIFVTIVYKIFDKFRINKYIQNIVIALKASGCALLFSVFVKLLITSNLHIFGIIILSLFIIFSFIKKLEPLLILFICGALGFISGVINLPI